jgi:hypothetical protein
MNQSEVIGGALIGGFLLYLAMNKRLGTYWAIMTGAGGSGGSGSAAAATPPATTGQGGVISGSGIANQAAGSQGTAGTPAVVGQPGSPAFVPTPNTIWNFLSGNWWRPAQTTTQGTQTPAGSQAAGGGIGMM